MPDYSQIINAFILSAQQRVGGKSSINSIDPVDVSGCDQDLATLLLPIINTINNFNILGGTLPPSNSDGVNDDLYIQGGTSLTFWKKQDGSWINKVVVPLGVTILDGNINIQTSVNGYIVTCSSGQWGINNVIYTKATQTQFTVPAAHPTLDRIDAVFGNNVGSGNLIYQTGTPASGLPPEPLPPPNNVLISYIYVPSAASGQLPYIANTNSGGGGSGSFSKVVISGTQADVSAFGTRGRLSVSALNANTPFMASYTLAGVLTVLSPTMLQGGFLYGFPNPSSNNFTYTITYIL